jgi:hypothetical protein
VFFSSSAKWSPQHTSSCNWSISEVYGLSLFRSLGDRLVERLFAWLIICRNCRAGALGLSRSRRSSQNPSTSACQLGPSFQRTKYALKRALLIAAWAIPIRSLAWSPGFSSTRSQIESTYADESVARQTLLPITMSETTACDPVSRQRFKFGCWKSLS